MSFGHWRHDGAMPPRFSLITASAAAVAFLAVLLRAALWEVTCLTRSLPADSASDLHSLPYVPYRVSAPAASSLRLRLVARLTVSSPLGDRFARWLLDRNGVTELVELADAIQRDVGPDSGREWGLGEPLVRLSAEEYGRHVAAAEAEEEERAWGGGGAAAGSGASGDGRGGRYRSLRDYRAAYLSGASTPPRVLDRLLRFVGRVDPHLRFVQEIDGDGSDLAASRSAERYANNASLGVWDGVPVFVKAEIGVRGLRTTYGRQMRPDGSDVAKSDETIVARLRDAGAVLVGTTVMHERGVQPTGFNPWYGGPRNPHDPERFPGGSSSGSAVAVATGAAPVAVGFDGGGSIRIPASWSGTVGLAAGYGRIPHDGSSMNVLQVAKSGVLTGTVDDAAEALLLLGRPPADRGHAYRALYGGDGPPPPHLRPRWDGGGDGRPVRVGVFWDWASDRQAAGSGPGDAAQDDAVYEAFVGTVRGLTAGDRAGPRRFALVNFTVPHMRHQALAHGLIITAAITFVMAKELFRGSSSRESPDPRDYLQPATEIQAKLGSQITALELMSCQRIRAWALSRWREVLSRRAGVILTPTTPMTALVRPPGSDEAGLTDTGLFVQMMRYVWPGNLLGLPGLAVPAGVDADGMPISVQVICTHWHEADCLAVGREIEHMHRADRPQPRGDFYVDLLA